jgi:hypothetical protein
VPQRLAGTARICQTPGCERLARRRGRSCGRCATRQWRKLHTDELAEREAQRAFPVDQLPLRQARGYLSAYLRRGTIQRQPCQRCGAQEVVPHFPDLAKPREVVWFCRQHRTETLEAIAQANADAAQAAKNVKWRSDRERFADEFPRLSQEIQAYLRTASAAAIASDPRLRYLSLAPDAPLAQHMLIRTYLQWAQQHEASINA